MTPPKSLGMMSGTSIDGSISAAIIETDGENFVRRIATDEYVYEAPEGLRSIHHLTKAGEAAYRDAKGDHDLAAKIFPKAAEEYVRKTFLLDEKKTQEKLRELTSAFMGGGSSAVEMSDIIRRSTELHAEAARRAIQKTGIRSDDVQYIGYHGQTLYHDPFFNRVTVQVGDPQSLADSLRIPTVFDFRSDDVKHGGQGAPLAPVYHRALVRSAGIESAAILNLGGTANVTVVSSKTDDMLGFDTGPANGLIDRYVKEKVGVALDRDSRLANTGKVSDGVVQALVQRAIILKDGRNYLDIQPPKSLDIRDYTFDIPEFSMLSVEDGCATLNAFTAECVALGIPWMEKAGYEVPKKWVLCGGGTFSPNLRAQLTARLSARIGAAIELLSADDLGWSAQGMEAELMAYLAVRSAKGLPITFPGTTGVREPQPGGRVYYPEGAS